MNEWFEVEVHTIDGGCGRLAVPFVGGIGMAGVVVRRFETGQQAHAEANRLVPGNPCFLKHCFADGTELEGGPITFRNQFPTKE
jgi:hypothetical protein